MLFRWPGIMITNITIIMVIIIIQLSVPLPSLHPMITIYLFLTGMQMLKGPPAAGVVNILFGFKTKAKRNDIQYI